MQIPGVHKGGGGSRIDSALSVPYDAKRITKSMTKARVISPLFVDLKFNDKDFLGKNKKKSYLS